MGTVNRMPYTRDELIQEIDKRKPWFQRIEFPEFGISTTDREDWVLRDAAHDNLFPGMDPAQAPVLRPQPKFDRFKSALPDVTGKSVLEVGTSCGFFALEFARRGAKRVTGLDIDINNVERAQLCAHALDLRNVRFLFLDLAECNDAHDVVFGASLHEHFLFPFYYFARLLCLAKETLILETHHLIADDARPVVKVDVYSTPGGGVGHAFHFSRDMFSQYLLLLDVPPEDAKEHVFHEDSSVRRLLMIVDTRRFQERRKTNLLLRSLRHIK